MSKAKVSKGEDIKSVEPKLKDKQKKEPRHARFRKYDLVNAGKLGQPKWALRRFLRFLAYVILLPLFRVRVTGAENIPKGPCLLSPNHVSYADGLLVFALSKRFNIPLRILAKRKLWTNPLFGWVLDSTGMIPVTQGGADLDALKTASRALKAGDSVGIFPEGTRVRTGSESEDSEAGSNSHANDSALGEATGGAAWLSIRNKVPVIPVAIAGTERIRPDGALLIRFPRVTIHFGEALYPDIKVPSAEYAKKERIQKLTELIMDGIASSLDIASSENTRKRA